MNKSKTNRPWRCLPITTHITTVHCCCMNAQYRSSSYTLSMLCLCLVQLSKSQRSNADSWPDWQMLLWLVSSWLITGALIALTVHHMTLITSQGQGRTSWEAAGIMGHWRNNWERTQCCFVVVLCVVIVVIAHWFRTIMISVWTDYGLGFWKPLGALHYTTAIVRHFLQNKAHVKSWDGLQKFVHIQLLQQTAYTQMLSQNTCTSIHLILNAVYFIKH